MNTIKNYKLWEGLDSDDRIVVSYLKPTRQKINGSEILELIKINQIDNFKNDFIGWLKISPKYKGMFFNVTQLIIQKNILNISFDSYFNTSENYIKTSSKLNIIIDSNLQIQKFIVKKPNGGIKTQFDPYGEEDWNWDLY